MFFSTFIPISTHFLLDIITFLQKKSIEKNSNGEIEILCPNILSNLDVIDYAIVDKNKVLTKNKFLFEGIIYDNQFYSVNQKINDPLENIIKMEKSIIPDKIALDYDFKENEIPNELKIDSKNLEKISIYKIKEINDVLN